MIQQKKLGTRLIGAFTAIALLTLALGALAVFNMLRVRHTAQELAVEIVPAVGVANEVERWSLQTMYEARGYAYSEQPEYLERARANLARVKQHLAAATAHAEKYDLAELRANARRATEKAAAYERLLAETAQLTEAIHHEEKQMNDAAAAYVKNCDEFLHAQSGLLEHDIGQLAAEKLTEDKVKERTRKTQLASAIIELGGQVRIGAWKAIATRDPTQFRATMQLFTQIDARLDQLKALTHVEEHLTEIAACRTAAGAYLAAMQRFLGHWEKREAVGQQRNATAAEVLAAAESTAKSGMQNTTTASDGAATSLGRSSNLLIAGSVLCVVLGLGLGVIMTRSITRPILAVADSLSAGAQQAAAAAGQVSASSQSLASGASQQAASLEETTSSLEEMASMTKRNSENAGRANALAREARQAADTGATDMQAMSTAMADIKTSSDDIAKIIKTIDEIAFQTNILALNAAVEAARAGEAGMGFAVVAEEVRNLAQRSAVAAKETAAKIEGAIGKTALGVELTGKVGRALQEIVTKAKQVDELVTEVAQASREQTDGIAQLNTAVGQIDQVTQSNAANAEESASAAEEMSAQTEALKEAVGQLLALVHGSAQAAPAAPVAARPAPATVAGPRRDALPVTPAPHREPPAGKRRQPAADLDRHFTDVSAS